MLIITISIVQRKCRQEVKPFTAGPLMVTSVLNSVLRSVSYCKNTTFILLPRYNAAPVFAETPSVLKRDGLTP